MGDSQPLSSTIPSLSESLETSTFLRNLGEVQLISKDNPNPFESSDEDCEISLIKVRKRIQKYSDSESDLDKDIISNTVSETITKDSSDSDVRANLLLTNSTKTIKKNITGLDSDSDTVTKNVKQQNRLKDKRNKLKTKFKSLLNSREKDVNFEKKLNQEESTNNMSDLESENSNDGELSIDNIKQKIKERISSLKMTICDPDTSDEESNQIKQIQRPKKQQKRTIPTSPKHQRMSAKQAMENMNKIKSESNRMLREKEVSLPYHRPKALSLKDIMSRRKPALSSDGKTLPLKMNSEQLQQYALLLEQRQKEIMELCKSDTDDDEPKDELDLTNTTDLRNKDNDSVLVINSITEEINSEADRELSITEKNDKSDKSNQIGVYDVMTEEIIESNTYMEINTECDELKNENNDISKGMQGHSEGQNASADMELVYNDSIEDTINDCESEHMMTDITKNSESKCIEETEIISKDVVLSGEKAIENRKSNDETSLENLNNVDNNQSKTLQLHVMQENTPNSSETSKYEGTEESNNAKNVDLDSEIFDTFSDDDADLEEINSMIEKAEILKVPVIDAPTLEAKPKLIGAPGMIIDLDGSNPEAPKMLSGVELLKERFTYFAKLKTPEEMERGREKRQKPGTQHIKLRQELEDKIAEQRSHEWAMRLQNEKQQQKEMDAIRGDDSYVEDDIDKIEAKLMDDKESSAESEEELLENDILIEDKPRKKNPLLEDEAEESEDDTDQNSQKYKNDCNDSDIAEDIEKNADESEEEECSDEEESSESDNDTNVKPKKGRILKAFEDSDDEGTENLIHKQSELIENNITEDNLDDKIKINSCNSNNIETTISTELEKPSPSTDSQEGTNINLVEKKIPCEITESQDDIIQLAQVPASISEDLFTSQESIAKSSTEALFKPPGDNLSQDLGSQTFSILNSNTTFKHNIDLENGLEKLDVISETQPFDNNLDAVVGMCSGSFSQDFIEFKPSPTQSQTPQSQVIGEDVLEMCTGKFYDNEFVSQPEENDGNISIEMSEDLTLNEPETDGIDDDKENNDKVNQDNNILTSVLDELNEPEFETSKPLKYFFDAKDKNKEVEANSASMLLKKKFIIDSDDETVENSEDTQQKRKKKLKKKKAEKRALQISDDEEDDYSEPDGEDFLSENEDIDNDEVAKLIEYDSEENEVEINHQKPKKRKATDFFEQEAELSSEDEWMGSGDEDEAGLDRMEREAGDDDKFNQNQLQRELGQIHMRDVLDQDKREVRLIQELLFEDGDLAGGGRQRKFRWRNADNEEEGTVPSLTDTLEEEFESEEQWRKQRHERETFLRQMKNEGEAEEDLNVTVNRNSIIKANLLSKTMSSLLEEANNKTNEEESPPLPEKKTVKDIPSPKKPFSILQQNYHGSLLTRGRGALARLAALATPLAVDDDAPKIGHLAPSSKRNFVFAAITPEDKQPKVTKRKAETNIGTPQLVKKLKTEERKKQLKSSLLDLMRK